MIEENPLVSVIIPVYNAENYIVDTVNSALNQTWENLEVVIIDDVSTDNTYEKLRQNFASNEKVQLFQLPKNNGGPAWGRNFGITKATGKYFAFLDADDLWAPQKIEFQLKALESENLLFCSTNKQDFTGNFDISSLSKDFNLDQVATQKISHSDLLKKNIINNSSVLAHRDLFKDIKFIEDKSYIATEDYLCWLNIHQVINKSLYIQNSFLYYRVLSTSISRGKLAMAKKIWNLLSKYRFKGNDLGWKKYYYFCTYVLKSLRARI